MTVDRSDSFSIRASCAQDYAAPGTSGDHFTDPEVSVHFADEQRVIAAALGLIGLFAGALGLLLRAGSVWKYSRQEPGAFGERLSAFANPRRARGSRAIVSMGKR
jgi:hypothetical protein